MISGGQEGILVVSSPADTADISFPANIVSPVLDIRVFAVDGSETTSFSGNDVEICFAKNGIDPDDVCLGYYNDKGAWECEDYCLDETSAGICGKSDHLTNFALLLDQDAGSSSKCGSTPGDQWVYVYLSTALVSCAIIAVLLGAIAVEIRLRRNRYLLNKQLTVRTISTNGSTL